MRGRWNLGARSRRGRSVGYDWRMALTVLVVEDEVKIRELLRAYLEREGWAVLTTASGAEAGLELLQALPAETVKSYQPFWAVSAHLLARLGRASEAADGGPAPGRTRLGRMRQIAAATGSSPSASVPWRLLR